VHGSHPVGELITSDVVVEWLTPHIDQLRQELFGNPARPFPTYEGSCALLVTCSIVSHDVFS
jgi:hypothetical protein